MPTIRDLVGAIRQREGVEAAIVLGRDGLLIEGDAVPQLNAEHIAAHAPSLVTAAEELGAAADRGEFATAVVEFAGGVAIVAAMSRDAQLLVLARPAADISQLLRELRRNRDQLAALA
jgi:predicted regulator of Ras-like GTPase activity (Roadblock/LC7/MglB family)